MIEPHRTMQWIWLIFPRFFTFVTEVGLARRLQWNLSNTDTLKTTILVLIGEVASFHAGGEYSCKLGTQSSVPINQVSLFQGCPLREVPLYAC